MINHNFNNWFRGSKDIKLDIVNKTLFQHSNRAIMPVLLFIPHQYIYCDMQSIAKHFIPFFKHYFSFYKPSQKLVSLKYLQNFNIFDRELFESFTHDINQALKPYSKEAQLKNIATICEAQDPITNETHDRFYDILAILDFYLEQLHESPLNVEGCELNDSSRAKLTKLVLDKIKRDPTLTLHYIKRPNKSFDPSLKHLFKTN